MSTSSLLSRPSDLMSMGWEADLQYPSPRSPGVQPREPHLSPNPQSTGGQSRWAPWCDLFVSPSLAGDSAQWRRKHFIRPGGWREQNHVIAEAGLCQQEGNAMNLSRQHCDLRVDHYLAIGNPGQDLQVVLAPGRWRCPRPDWAYDC